MINEKLAELKLPDIKAPAEMYDTLCREEYGYLPPRPLRVWTTELPDGGVPRFCAGKAPLHKLMLHAELPQGEFAFPFYCSVPQDGQKHPAFLHINFRDAVPDLYQPSEELCDNGYGVFTFCYNDVSPDRDDGFREGLGAVLFKDGKRAPTDAGKISLWAWAASAVMDYICLRNDILCDRVSVVGHSRLGKTALWAGASDKRFYCAFSNDSGCSGAAITRGKQGETAADIIRVFPYWFCENYYKYTDRESEMPFDQHWLLSLMAGRLAYVASAGNDLWADPDFEYMSCWAAQTAFGAGSFVAPDRLPRIGDSFPDGSIGYHLRAGEHFLGREDWLHYMDFLAIKA